MVFSGTSHQRFVGLAVHLPVVVHHYDGGALKGTMSHIVHTSDLVGMIWATKGGTHGRSPRPRPGQYNLHLCEEWCC